MKHNFSVIQEELTKKIHNASKYYSIQEFNKIAMDLISKFFVLHPFDNDKKAKKFLLQASVDEILQLRKQGLLVAAIPSYQHISTNQMMSILVGRFKRACKKYFLPVSTREQMEKRGQFEKPFTFRPFVSREVATLYEQYTNQFNGNKRQATEEIFYQFLSQDPNEIYQCIKQQKQQHYITMNYSTEEMQRLGISLSKSLYEQYQKVRKMFKISRHDLILHAIFAYQNEKTIEVK